MFLFLVNWTALQSSPLAVKPCTNNLEYLCARSTRIAACSKADAHHTHSVVSHIRVCTFFPPNLRIHVFPELDDIRLHSGHEQAVAAAVGKPKLLRFSAEGSEYTADDFGAGGGFDKMYER